MKSIILSPCLLVVLALASAPAAAQTQFVEVRAWIDGYSELTLRGADVQWQHFDFAAPGRLDCDTGSPIEPTYVNSIPWFPVWPDVPTCENRFCEGCFSDSAALLSPPLPSQEFLARLIPLQNRGGLGVVEQPHAGNGYKTVVAIDDNSFGGADWYWFSLAVEPCFAENVCTSTPNSTGSPATMVVTGDLSIGSNKTYLQAFDCPPGRLGIFLYGTNPANIPLANGRLCIDPFAGIHRLQALQIDAAGTVFFQPDLQANPYLPDQDFYFQFWFRDPLGGGTGSNLTDAVRVRFCL